MASNTIKKYLLQFSGLCLTIEQADTMSDVQLADAFLLEKPTVVNSRVASLEVLL